MVFGQISYNELLFSLITQKFSKFIYYLSYTKKISKLNKIPFFYTLKDLYDFLLKENKTIPETNYLDNDMIRSKKVFSFDKSWDDYYVMKYGYNIKNLIYIGNPDLMLLKEVDINKQENSVCYICQSLVEDGRLEKNIYQDFLKKLADSVCNSKTLYIKLHPRSKIELYDVLKNYKNIKFTSELPICKSYVGHYSGLIATVKQITNKILIWLLPNHHVPEYFKNLGLISTSSEKVLYDFVNKNYKVRKQKKFLIKVLIQ